MPANKKKVLAAANGHVHPLVGDANHNLIMPLGGPDDKSGFVNAAARWILGLKNHDPLCRVKPTDPRFQRGGDMESLGFALGQLQGLVGVGSHESITTIFNELKTDYADDPLQTGLLDSLAKTLAVKMKESTSHEVIPVFAEAVWTPPRVGNLADAEALLGETKYVWPGYIMAGGLNAIAGDVGAGKTVLVMDLHRRQYHGLSWPDGAEMETAKKPILWLMADCRVGQLVDLCREMSVPLESVCLAHGESVLEPLLLDDPANLVGLANAVKQVSPWALVVDTYTSAMGSLAHTKPEVMNAVTSSLIDIATSHGIPVILLCHTNDAGGIYGKALARKCEHILTIVLSDRNDLMSGRNIHPKRSRRLEECQSWGVEYHREGWGYCSPHHEVADGPSRNATVKPSLKDTVSLAALEMAAIAGPDGFTQIGLVMSLAVDDGLGEKGERSRVRNRVSRAIKALVESGDIVERSGRYYLPGRC